MAENFRRNSRNFPNQNDRGRRQGSSRGGGDGGPSGGGERPQSAEPEQAAVPWYLGQTFEYAPPGHRYLAYLPFWRNDWSAVKEGKQRILRSIGVLPEYAVILMRALAQRQYEIGNSIDAEVFSATSTSPFATGLGWEHPNENGFAFLQPYGLPYLAGSGVKGVIRQAARKLAAEGGSATGGWTDEAIEALFGPPPEEDEGSRGALRFFDVIPELDGNNMGVDIMNPHYGQYYKGHSFPHDAGSPVPIFFLVVPPGSKFTFVVDCPRERYLLPDLKARWRDLLRAAFEHAFDWLGFGAKTAVGYGAMSVTPAAATQIEEAVRRLTEEPLPRPQNDSVAAKEERRWDHATIVWNPGPREIIAVEGQNRALARGKDADNFLMTLTEQQRKQLLERKRELTNLRVVVEITGNQQILKRQG